MLVVMTVLNAWGEPIEVEDDPTERDYVPPDQRLDVDEGPASDALGPDKDGVDTGDDLDGWKPGDPV